MFSVASLPVGSSLRWACLWRLPVSAHQEFRTAVSAILARHRACRWEFAGGGQAPFWGHGPWKNRAIGREKLLVEYTPQWARPYVIRHTLKDIH